MTKRMAEWKYEKLGDICTIEKGVTGLARAVPGEYPLVATGANRKTSRNFQFDAKAVCIPLVSSTGHGKKTLNYVHYQEGKFALGSILAAIIPRDEKILSARYLHVYLQKNKDRVIVPLMRGAANVSLSIKAISNIEVPIPPLEQQLKLLDKIDSISGEHEQFLNEIDVQATLFEKLRQAILQEAIEGKLTAKWRGEHPDLISGDNHASKLLEKIKAEKETLIKEGKIRKDKPLPPISYAEKPFNLPDGWVWCRLGEVAKTFGGYAYESASFKKDGFNQVLRLGNIRPDHLRYYENPVFISDELANATSEFRLRPYDILITMTGTRNKRDYLYSAMINESDASERKLYINQRVGCIRPIGINAKFLSLLLKHDVLLNIIFASSTGSANQANIGIGALYAWSCPLPPLNEQQAIVEGADKLISIIDSIEKQVSERKEQSEQLMQAVLSEAFEE
jgi:type I restriction enzyme S subunit